MASLKITARELFGVNPINQFKREPPPTNPRPSLRLRRAALGAVRGSRCWSVSPVAASLRSTETHGSDGGRVKMPRLRVSFQGPHPAAVLPQCLPGVCSKHHRPDPGGRDPGTEPSVGQLRLRLPGHGQDESLQRDGQRIRLLHAVPAEVSQRGEGFPAGQPAPTLLTHLPAVSQKRLPGRAGAPGFPSEPAAGGHRGAVPAEPRRLLCPVLLLLIL